LRRDRIDENSLLQFSEAHSWNYAKDQMPSDLIVFQQADSTNTLPSKCIAGRERMVVISTRGFHCAVANPNAGNEGLRESVEVRLVKFR
jgi:hypothetical protein